MTTPHRPQQDHLLRLSDFHNLCTKNGPSRRDAHLKTTLRQRQSGLAAGLAFTAALAAQLACHGASVSPASAAQRDRAAVLQTFPAGKYSFELVIAPCRSDECPVQVWLRQQGKVVDRFTLPVSAYTRRATTEAVGSVWGADVGLKAWATGVENRYVSTAGRTATVAPGKTGLLVTQNFGFEHPKRAHVFLLPGDGKLAAAWSHQEGSGPTWTSTELIPGNTKDIRDIVNFRGFRDPDEDTPERLGVIRLSWDAASAGLRETLLPDRANPLYLASVGTYPSISEARRARDVNGYCLGAYWVLDAARFPALSGGKAVLGRIYTRREAADAAARSVKECLPAVASSVLRWTEGR